MAKKLAQILGERLQFVQMRFVQSQYVLSIEVHPRSACSRRERLCVIRPEALHERSLADLDVAEKLFAIWAKDLKPSVRVPRVCHVAEMVRDSVVEERDQRAKRHARKNAIDRAL